MTDQLAQAIDEARDAELAVGSLRGRAVEFRTQIDRARQDVELGWRYWARRRIVSRSKRPRAGRVSGPVVSVITPVFRTKPEHLRACLRSVAEQTYQSWEHILVDDGSADPDLVSVLARAARDRRVTVISHQQNLGIVAASNTALGAAGGEFVTMLDHDDVLVPTALEHMVSALRAAPGAVFAYSDNAVLRSDGRVVSPFYKPDFSPERLRSHNYVLHSVMSPLATVREVGAFRTGFDGAQDHDLLLRLAERGPVVHVPEVLYHWREAPASVATDRASKPYAYEAGTRAVQEHCDRIGVNATVERGSADGIYRLRRRTPDGVTVSVVIPTRGTAGAVWGVDRVHVVEAVRSVRERSSFEELEFVVVADEDTADGVLDQVRAAGAERVVIVPFDGEFNFSAKVNVGAANATGDLLLFLNDDTELIEPASIGEMAALLAEPDVGMVGAKLLYADGTLQHGGHVYPGLATHAFLGYPGDHPLPGDMGRVVRECSGVTAAAAMMRADLFASLGGFDERFPRNFNDVDLSLRVRAGGHRILWTPYASWYHFESASRDPATGDDERDLLLSRWRAEIDHDPYYNVNLAPHRSDWLERPGRSGAPPYYLDANGRRRFS